MPKSRRRRFFATQENKFQAQISDVESSGIDPSYSQLLPPPASAEEEVAEPTGDDLSLQSSTPDFADQNAAGSDALPAAFRLLPSRPHRAKSKPHSFFFWLAALLACGVSGILIGYFVPRPATNAPTGAWPESVGTDSNPVEPTDQGELDAAYAARESSRFTEAEQMFTALGRKHPDWGTMEVEVGRTLLYAGNLKAARVVLTASGDKGPTRAEANFLLGTLFVAEKLYPQAESSFAKAVELNPTDPNYYYFWGECLRKEGKVLAAIPKFRSALLRNQYETASGLYRLKLWLSEIEADLAATDGVNAEIDAALSQSIPSMEALVAAAARDVKAGDATAATNHLNRARERMDPAVFRIVMNDPFFAPLRSRPEFVEAFKLVSPGSRLGLGESVGSPTPSAVEGKPAALLSARASPAPTKGE